VIETRRDRGNGIDDLPPDIKGLFDQAAWKEPLEARQELMEKLKNGSIAVHHVEQSSSWMDEIRKIQPGFLDALKTVINPENMTLKHFIEFMEMAERTGKVIPVGGSRVHLVEALPTDERINCPECDAVISKYAEKCEWCSVSLNPAVKEI